MLINKYGKQRALMRQIDVHEADIIITTIIIIMDKT